MQVIRLSYPITQKITGTKVVLALGFFDGVHIGHQRLIAKARLISQQKGLPLMVLTFDRHPKEIYKRQKPFRYLSTNQEKIDEMAALGVDYLVFAKFTAGFSHLPPQDFIDKVIIKLQADTVVAGFDYTYGPKEIANMSNLAAFAKERFNIVKLEKQSFDGQKIGSTEIRQAIGAGHLELANRLLGRVYTTTGTITHGKRNGHRLGFPTANLQITPNKVVPKIGVYATRTKISDHWYDSMTSVGYNVTFDQEKRLYIESNLFGFDQEAYGKLMTIAWYHYIRSEVKFDSLSALTTQLQNDQVTVQAYFAQPHTSSLKTQKN